MEQDFEWGSSGRRNFLVALGFLLLGTFACLYFPVRIPIQEALSLPTPALVVGRAGGRGLSDEELELLLTTPSPLGGFQNKTGPLNPLKWLPELRWWRLLRLNQWFDAVKDGRIDIQSQPFHVGFGCEVYVNHDYHYFWIRQLKTASTTVESGLGGVCKGFKEGNNDSHHCSSYPWNKPRPENGDPGTWWRDYFVFTTVRNPYSRFASAYRFLLERNFLNQTMGESCRNPFLVNQRNSRWSHGNDHYLRHMMEQTSCLFTEQGGLAVDFIGRMETIDEDFKIIAQEINKRKRSDLTPIDENIHRIRNTNPDKSQNDTYASLFRQYPECIEMVEKVFRNEFEDLKYIEGV